jgi:hypothetical protein
MLTPPITKQAKQQEWKIVHAVDQNNGFPVHIVRNLRKKLTAKIKNITPNHNNKKKKKMGNILILQSTNTKDN